MQNIMNRFGKISLVLLVVAACHVHGQTESSTPCSLSFYRYLFNLPGEQIRPNVPEGTYLFGKRVGPPTPEGQASNVQPAVVKPPFESREYLPPTTTTTTTTTLRPTTSAPVYIPPPSPQVPYYPAAESTNTVSVVQPAKPACDHPEHVHVVDTELLPPYQIKFQPQPTFQPLPTFRPQPTFQPQPTFFVPRFVPAPQVPVAISDNEIFAEQRKPVSVQRFAVPTPPPQFLRPYIAPAAPAPAEDCDRHVHVSSTTTTTTTTTTTPKPEPSTVAEALVETRQNEISVVPEAKHPADCGHKHHNVVVESLGVPSTDYGVVSAPAPSAGYSYDRPSEPLAYPSASTGYTYPKASPSFEYPGALFESESSKSSAGGTQDGDLVILKV